MKDALGRENRKIPDRRCNECSKACRPVRFGSKYCSRICSWKNNGKKQGQYIDHEVWWVNSKGYIEGRVWRGGTFIRIRQHRWVMEQYLGRPLLINEELHHINEDKTDNRIENLEFVEHNKHASDHGKRMLHKSGYKMRLTNQERQRRSDFMKEVHRRRQENDPTNKWYARTQVQQGNLYPDV